MLRAMEQPRPAAMPKLPLRSLFAALLLSLSTLAAAAPGDVRVLFIGNSLTYTNQLPKIVKAVAKAAGGPRFRVNSETRPGAALEDHMGNDRLEVRLWRGRWDFVVMQQGPSALPESRVMLRRDVAVFAEQIRLGGGEPAVYQVWPEDYRPEAFPAVLESYRLAAEDVGARLLPVGLAWQAAWSLDPTLPLYGPDGFHPSQHGSYLAALVIYEGLTGQSAVGIPGTLKIDNRNKIRISDAHAALLQRAAEMVRQPQPLARPR
jgi:hypothetical protein